MLLTKRAEQRLKKFQSSHRKDGQKLHIDFQHAGFGGKKLIARAFIEKILLQNDTTHAMWKI